MRHSSKVFSRLNNVAYNLSLQDAADLITYVLSRSCMNCRHMLSMPGSRERRRCLLASAGNGRKLHVFMASSTEATRHGTTKGREQDGVP